MDRKSLPLILLGILILLIVALTWWTRLDWPEPESSSERLVLLADCEQTELWSLENDRQVEFIITVEDQRDNPSPLETLNIITDSLRTNYQEVQFGEAITAIRGDGSSDDSPTTAPYVTSDGKIAIQAVRFGSNPDFCSVENWLREQVAEIVNPVIVFIEPNYSFTVADTHLESCDIAEGGSPGTSGSIAGFPYATPAAVSQLMYEQPALDLMGIEVITGTGVVSVPNVDEIIESMGNVQIVILDSWPENIIHDSGIFELWPTNKVYTIKDLTPTELLDDHGYSVYSQISMLVPQARTRVYRVLATPSGENRLSGRVSYLIATLKHYRESVESLNNSIIHMSLGIDCIGSHVKSLESVLLDFHEGNATIVAAAGNYSATVSTFPANLDWVISVGATEISSPDKSCFSNKGQIYAPGGGCDQLPDKCDIDGTTNDTADDACEELGIIAAASSNEFLAWRGTSFAAPFVTSLAAMLQAQDLQRLPSDILPLIDCGMQYNNGVIHFGASLDSNMCP